MDHTQRLLVVCAIAPAFLAGCAATTTQPQDRAPSAALEDLGPPPARPAEADPDRRSLAETARQSAQDLEVLMDRLHGGPPALGGAIQTPEPAGTQRPWQRETANQTNDASEQTAVEAEPIAPANQDVPEDAPVLAEVVPQPPAPDPVQLLLARLEQESADPERALAATMLAQAIRAYGNINDGARPGQQLSPSERQLAEVIQPVIDALAAGDRADAPQRIGQAIETASRELAAVLPVRISDAALATDIYGFAAYRPFESYAFLAGRQNRMLLYTEPAQFESRLTADPASQGEAANPGAYEVQLGLELRLFNERGSMLAWRRPEERVAIRSDRPRSEIYLGTMIDLPASLSVGRYQLKVILRDLADGSEDERVIPIEIVADPRLTARPTRDR